MIDRIERYELPPLGADSFESSETSIPCTQTQQVDTAGLQRRLGRDVTRNIALLHGGHRMPAHDRVAIEARDSVIRTGEKMPKCLIAADRRGCDEHRGPG